MTSELTEAEVQHEQPITAPKFFDQFLSRRPEILQISTATYLKRPHGVLSTDTQRGLVPILTTDRQNLRGGEWPRTSLKSPEIAAIGSVVDVCDDKGCNHTNPEHEDRLLLSWKFWHDGITTFVGKLRSFIYLDIETHSLETFGIVRRFLMTNEKDGYILNSGGGFHVVFDDLVDIGDLPLAYGETIAALGKFTQNNTLQQWGGNLVEHSGTPTQVRKWCDDVLVNFGHIDDSLDALTRSNQRVTILDIRHTAHSLLRALKTREAEIRGNQRRREFDDLAMEESGAAYLRISPKTPGHGEPPILIAQQVSGVYSEFDGVNDIEPKQQRRLF